LVDLFARVIIAARFPIIVGWVAAAAVMALALPTLREAQTGALGQLVPANSRASGAVRPDATVRPFVVEGADEFLRLAVPEWRVGGVRMWRAPSWSRTARKCRLWR